ncbi:hypothetical protein DPMN_100609 [Dreissena polymorpha]|uniref:Uncharacterized protein n=1 Tax=Dreissena polymorpha TaxID=45954 RepID=A0A9D4LG86_DREPO|nr:hypothetical protein DPMN_100609 [Dreissena polymorpha]
MYFCDHVITRSVEVTRQRPTRLCWWGPGVGNVDMDNVQYQFEIDRVVIRDVQYKFEPREPGGPGFDPHYDVIAIGNFRNNFTNRGGVAGFGIRRTYTALLYELAL